MCPVPCPFCDHDDHAGTYCAGWTDLDSDEPCCPHECVCSYPNPDNFTEVPERDWVPLSVDPGEAVTLNG